MRDNLEIIEFTNEHSAQIVNSMNDRILSIDDKYFDLLKGLEVKDMSFTAVKDNKIICSGGVIPLWEGVFEGWVMATHLIWKNRIGAAKVIKAGMENLIRKNKIIRLQTAVKKEFPLGHRFAEWLGMQNEGLMKKYQNNEDYIRYARVK
jgi:hypothetical protein